MARPGARFTGPLPGAMLVQAVNEAARRASAEIGAVAASMVKESLLQDQDSRGFTGRADTGLAHDLVAVTPPAPTATGWKTETGIGPPRAEISGVLEKGRRPGRPPPPAESLIPWVKRNLGDSIASTLKGARVTVASAKRAARREKILARKGLAGRTHGPKVSGVSKESLEKRVRGMAFVIARSIGNKGTPGLHMFEKAAKRLRGGRAASILRSAFHRTLAEAKGRGGIR